jgi:hypothetical protein
MRAIKKARKLIEKDPTSKAATALTNLILALETGSGFSFHPMYELSMNEFDLAIEVIKDWRLDRYYEGKVKALDVALQASETK